MNLSLTYALFPDLCCAVLEMLLIDIQSAAYHDYFIWPPPLTPYPPSVPLYLRKMSSLSLTLPLTHFPFNSISISLFLLPSFSLSISHTRTLAHSIYRSLVLCLSLSLTFPPIPFAPSQSLRTMSMNELMYVDENIKIMRNCGALRIYFIYERIN